MALGAHCGLGLPSLDDYNSGPIRLTPQMRKQIPQELAGPQPIDMAWSDIALEKEYQKMQQWEQRIERKLAETRRIFERRDQEAANR